MSVTARWNTRQIGLELLSYVLCFTTALVIAPMVIQCMKYLEFGREIYPGAKWAKDCGPLCTNQVFWQYSLLPIVKWLPLTLVGDAILRRFIYRIRE
jgi:hypothetical protein